MIVHIEVSSLGLYFLNAESFQGLDELLVDELHALPDSLGIVALVCKGALKVIYHGQNGCDGLLSATQNEVSLFLHGTLAVVVKLCLHIEHLGLQF